MSPELETPILPEVECAGGCSPSHRWTRLFLMGIVLLLFVAIVSCTLYLALTGGFNT